MSTATITLLPPLSLVPARSASSSPKSATNSCAPAHTRLLALRHRLPGHVLSSLRPRMNRNEHIDGGVSVAKYMLGGYAIFGCSAHPSSASA